MQEERHYLPSSAWSRNRMSSPAHAHTNTHFYTLANCERVSEEGWAREWERENAIRREGRSRKDAEDRESGEEMQQPERQWGGGEWGGGHIAAHTVMCAVLNCTCMTEVCVCACLCVRECVFPMSLSVEGKWQMWLSPLHDHLSFLHLSTLFCLLLSHSHWFEMSEPGEGRMLRLRQGELPDSTSGMDRWIKTDKKTQAKIAELSLLFTLCAF